MADFSQLPWPILQDITLRIDKLGDYLSWINSCKHLASLDKELHSIKREAFKVKVTKDDKFIILSHILTLVNEYWILPNGVIDGDFLQFCRYSGALFSTCRYVNGKLEGHYTSYHPNSDIPWVTATYKDGLLEGDYCSYDNLGKLCTQVCYTQGKGILNKIHKGKTRVIEMANGHADGRTLYYGRAGQLTKIVHYKEGIPHGEMIVFHPDGSRKTYHYNMGALHGVYRHHDPQGTLIEEYHYKLGRQHGLARRWLATGQLISEENYYRNMRHGFHREWYPNGNIKSQEHFHNDVYDGIISFWRGGRKHRLQRQICYRRGEMLGSHKVWNIKGKLIVSALI